MRFSAMLQAAYDFWRSNRYKLKRYLLKDGKKHPFAVICPGGGYSMVCSFVEGRPYAKALNKLGYNAFVVYYRVKKKALYPAPVEDLERGIREALANADEWGLDPRGWSLWGSSAGGHLAASYCTRGDVPRPSALILTYPVITMQDGTHSGSKERLAGKDSAPELLEKLSVERNVGPDYPPTFAWRGTADDLVGPHNCRVLKAALEDAGVPFVFEEIEGAGHGVGLGEGLSWFEHAVSFWEKHRWKNSTITK